MTDWDSEREEYKRRRADALDGAGFLLLLVIAAVLVALVRQIAGMIFS